METLGFICLLVALVVLILKLFVMKDKQMLKWVVIGSLAGAGKKRNTFSLVNIKQRIRMHK